MHFVAMMSGTSSPPPPFLSSAQPARALVIAIGKLKWPYCHIHVDRRLKAHSLMFFNSSD